jgi:hypothetical protein
MCTYVRIAILALGIMMPWKTRAVDDCLCPQVSCEATCEIETEIKFYSEKCDNGQRVRSCARPTCVKADPLPKVCVKDKPAASGESERAPASVALAPAPKVGVVEKLMGEAWIFKSETSKEILSVGSIISEQDVIGTGKVARLEVRFDDGNLILLGADSKVDLKKVGVSGPENDRKTTLELLKGKIRSKVNKKYTGASFYHVKTKSAVAGVRGTDFVVSLDQNSETDQQTTRVDTFRGEVELIAGDDSEKAIIGARESASYVVSGFSARQEMKDFMVKGRMTPVVKMTNADANSLDTDMSVASADAPIVREVASVVSVPKIDATCKEPAAEFNQCSWVCLNNPKGESTCRTDMPQVQCLRRVCKADGKWSDQQRLPASHGNDCDPNKLVVAPCDY